MHRRLTAVTALGALAIGVLACDVPTYHSADAGVTPTPVEDGAAGAAFVELDASQTGSDRTDAGSAIVEVDAARACQSDDDCVSGGIARHCGPDGQCVQCSQGIAGCAAGLYCTTAGLCAIGCVDDDGCAPAGLATPADAGADLAVLTCDVSTHACTGCTADTDCPLGTRCGDAGRCTPGCAPTHGCPPSWVCCQDGCVAAASAARGCSVCASLCANGHGATSCVADSCTPTCDPNYGDCDGDPNNGCESPLDTVTHCGRCGNRCTNDHGTTTCTSGVCTPICAAGFDDCDGNRENGCEANVNTDINHCKTCGHPCVFPNAVATCSAGTCAIDHCKDGFRDCDQKLENGCEVNIKEDLANCGACKKACTNANGTTACVDGTCTPQCATAFGNCDKVADNGCETEIGSDVFNCGECGKRCEADGGTPFCSRGVCGWSVCDPDRGNCDGNGDNACETDLTTVSNCGGCRHACSTNHGTPTCTFNAASSTATCSIACASGFGNCNKIVDDGCETPLNTVNDCKACETRCEFPNMSASCQTGSCVAGTCLGAYLDCANGEADGCETNGSTDPDHCGRCDIQCVNPNGSTSCEAGVCDPVCDPGWERCGGSAKDGCRVSLATNDNCGQCGKTCSANASCIDGQCVGYADIAVPYPSASAATVGSSLAIPHTLHTSRTDNNRRLIVVTVVTRTNTAVWADVKYNGTSLTQAVSAWSQNQAWAGIYYLDDARLPAETGTYVVNVVTPAGSAVMANVAELTGVDQSAPVDKTASFTHKRCDAEPPNDAVPFTTEGALGIDVLGRWEPTNVTPVAGTGQTTILNNSAAAVGALASYRPLSAGANMFSWTAACSNSGHALVSLRRAMIIE